SRGDNWFTISSFLFMQDINVLTEDTMWYVDPNGLVGGVFRTTKGGVSWTQQSNLGSLKPTNVYFYNNSFGFIGRRSGASSSSRTTDGGANWDVVLNEAFTDIHFIDSLTGWKANGNMKKTTDGGLNWITQTLPNGGIIITSSMLNISVINKDTIWGVGGYVGYPNSEQRGFLFVTTNGGNNWLYQIPDTSIDIPRYFYVQFTDKKKGWAYSSAFYGVHTKVGGDTITTIQQISGNIPEQFKLDQNYPNPFNTKTTISYELRIRDFVKLIVFDVTGRIVQELINQVQLPGTYQYTFDGSHLTSGIYFYKLQTDNFMDTKKMILVK